MFIFPNSVYHNNPYQRDSLEKKRLIEGEDGLTENNISEGKKLKKVVKITTVVSICSMTLFILGPLKTSDQMYYSLLQGERAQQFYTLPATYSGISTVWR